MVRYTSSMRPSSSLADSAGAGLTVGLGEHEATVSKSDLEKLNIVSDTGLLPDGISCLMSPVDLDHPKISGPIHLLCQDIYHPPLRAPLRNAKIPNGGVGHLDLYGPLDCGILPGEHLRVHSRLLFLE